MQRNATWRNIPGPRIAAPPQRYGPPTHLETFTADSICSLFTADSIVETVRYLQHLRDATSLLDSVLYV